MYFSRIKLKSCRPTFSELFFDRSSSYSFLIRFTSSLSEAFSCFKTSARWANSSHSACKTHICSPSTSWQHSDTQYSQVEQTITCLRNLDLRADSLLDCFLLCLLSSRSSWTTRKSTWIDSPIARLIYVQFVSTISRVNSISNKISTRHTPLTKYIMRERFR